MCPSVPLAVHLSLYLRLCVYDSMYRCVCTCPPVLPVFLCCPSVFLSVFLLIYLFIVRPPDSLSLSIYQAVCFLFCHFICLCVCFFCLSIYIHIYLFFLLTELSRVCAMHILIKTCSLLGRTHGPKTSPCRAVPPDPGAACSLSPNPPSSTPSTQLLAHLLPQATSHRLMSILELEQVSICDREAPSRWCTHQGLLLLHYCVIRRTLLCVFSACMCLCTF